MLVMTFPYRATFVGWYTQLPMVKEEGTKEHIKDTCLFWLAALSLEDRSCMNTGHSRSAIE